MTDTRDLEARLREEAANHQTVHDDDRRRKALHAEAADALAAMRAENEALKLILDACTEGTDWTYAQVPDELKALRAAAPKE